MTAKEIARELNVPGENHHNCCQSVYAAMCASYLDRKVEDCLDVGACFGGGLLCGEACGALVGGLMYIGSKMGLSEETVEIGQKYIEGFKAQNGGYMHCRELVNPEDENRAEICSGIIENAIDFLEKNVEKSI